MTKQRSAWSMLAPKSLGLEKKKNAALKNINAKAALMKKQRATNVKKLKLARGSNISIKQHPYVQVHKPVKGGLKKSGTYKIKKITKAK